MDVSVLGWWAVLYGACVTAPWVISSEAARKAVRWVPAAAGLMLLFLGRSEPAVLRLAAASAGMLYAFKGTILLSVSRETLESIGPVRSLAFMSVWPGMDPSGFKVRGTAPDDCGPRFVRGLLTIYAGLAVVGLLVLFFPSFSPDFVGWVGIAAILTVVHLGLSEILSSLANLLGFKVGPLFDRPFRSASLGELWTRRWNRPFVEMDRLLFLRPLTKLLGARVAVFGVFIVSGLLHEMAISYPAGAGYGGPLLYFAIQGALVVGERRLKVRSRLLVWLSILAPLPLLFHSAFRGAFIVPLFGWLHSLLVSHSVSWYFDKGLWLVGVMQLLVLMASFQVPGRLNWREELPRLSTFNRKLMWTNGAFIVLTIVSFGVLTLSLHSAFLRGESAALGLAIFITVFWTMRILVDCVFYKHEDWPKGPQFVIGHALLDSLFAFLVIGYGSYVVWLILT